MTKKSIRKNGYTYVRKDGKRVKVPPHVQGYNVKQKQARLSLDKAQKIQKESAASSSVLTDSKQRSGVLSHLRSLERDVKSAKDIRMIRRYLKYDEDKQRVNDVIKTLDKAGVKISELFHIVAHDEYWDELRRKR